MEWVERALWEEVRERGSVDSLLYSGGGWSSASCAIGVVMVEDNLWSVGRRLSVVGRKFERKHVQEKFGRSKFTLRHLRSFIGSCTANFW